MTLSLRCFCAFLCGEGNVRGGRWRNTYVCMHVLTRTLTCTRTHSHMHAVYTHSCKHTLAHMHAHVHTHTHDVSAHTHIPGCCLLAAFLALSQAVADGSAISLTDTISQRDKDRMRQMFLRAEPFSELPMAYYATSGLEVLGFQSQDQKVRSL